ncbi:MAG: ComF family protein [Candidatus Syntrophosphaera sp.]
MTAHGSLKRSKDILLRVEKLFFPPVCLACNAQVDSIAQTLCENCRDMLVPITEGFCTKCGGLLQDGKCDACSTTEWYFDAARSVYVYQTPVREMIHHLKYDFLLSPAAFLAKGMAALITWEDPGVSYDFILPVPLHRVRERGRGYNQSVLIARKLSALLGIPLAKMVSRKSNTRSQTNLSREARLKNLDGAFVMSGGTQISGKRILLIDDVFTTGTTANEISKLLKGNGAEKVFVLTAARAV